MAARLSRLKRRFVRCCSPLFVLFLGKFTELLRQTKIERRLCCLVDFDEIDDCDDDIVVFF